MHGFWYDYVKPILRKSKSVLYGYRQFHCIHIKDNIYKGITEDVKKRFDTSNYE